MYIDAIIRIKNGVSAKKDSVRVRYSKENTAVLEGLKRFGFIKDFEVRGRSFKKIIDVTLNYDRPLNGVKFLSKPSLRRYKGYREFRPVKSGYGVLFVSTPEGIMAGHEARKKKVGGQLLFEIW